MYALLIGSGVSSAAAVPTGWAMVTDLIHQIAVAENAQPGPDLERWYVEKYETPPRYGDLLNRLARTPAERQAILRAYIEPSEEQRQSGLRVPTKAHEAIARLVARGSIRVIITTNFDRLIEQALDQVGVSYDVIDGVDALKGARPFVHSPCTVIKVHGDYRDARIRNTPEELEGYEPELDAFLDQVLDAHGLLVCGWSATWDGALRKALTRQANRRFTTYWSVRGDLTEEARELIAARKAEVIKGLDANDLFTRLESMVEALADVNRPHPLSVATAVAEMKRYLPDPQARIRLEDLVLGAAERVVEATAPTIFVANGPPTNDEAKQRVARYQASVEILAALLAIGCSHSAGPDQDRLWSRSIARVAEVPDAESGIGSLIALRRYPALVCLYSGGVAAVATDSWPTLRELFLGRDVSDARQDMVPLVAALYPHSVIKNLDLDGVLHPDWRGPGTLKQPISDHFNKLSREALRSVLPSDTTYIEIFDRFEFLLGATLADLSENHEGDRYIPSGYLGSFAWRYGFGRRGDPAEWAMTELGRNGASWPLLRATLFGGDPGRAELAFKAIIDLRRRSGQWF